MSEEPGNAISRRTFMGAAASTAFACSLVPGKVLGKDAPGNKLNIALIGVGGQGGASLKDEAVRKENIVALHSVGGGPKCRAVFEWKRQSGQGKLSVSAQVWKGHSAET